MSTYHDLMVYKKSYGVALKMYKIVALNMPKEEQYGLTSQIKRAATSIPLNIAEGYAKNNGKAELLRFLSMAQGSCAEMEVLANFMKDLGYISEYQYNEVVGWYGEIGRMVSGLRKSVTTNI